MSWWETGDGKLMGDEPADVAGDALAAVAAERSARQLPKPNLKEILDALAVACRAAVPELVDAANRGKPARLVAIQEGGGRIEGDGANLAPGDPAVNLFAEAVVNIARAYQEDWERKPQLRELLYAFVFVLGGGPEDYLADAEGLVLDSIAAE
jgi:hypothetical protein